MFSFIRGLLPATSSGAGSATGFDINEPIRTDECKRQESWEVVEISSNIDSCLTDNEGLQRDRHTSVSSDEWDHVSIKEPAQALCNLVSSPQPLLAKKNRRSFTDVVSQQVDSNEKQQACGLKKKEREIVAEAVPLKCYKVTDDEELPWTGGYDPEDFENRKREGAMHHRQKRLHKAADPNIQAKVAKREKQRQEEYERQRLRQQGQLGPSNRQQRKAQRKASIEEKQNIKQERRKAKRQARKNSA